MAKSAKSAKKKEKSKDGGAARSLSDLQAQLTGGAKPKKKGAAKKARLTLSDLPEQTQELIREFVESKCVFDLVEKPFDAAKKAGKEAILPVFCELWYDKGVMPQNPAIQIKGEDGKVDHECMFLMSEKFFPQINMEEEDISGTVAETLVNSGLTRENAESFVENEFDFDPISSLHSFSRLSKGHKEGKDWIDATDAEKAVAEKLLKFALGENVDPLNDEERALCVYVEPNVTVKVGVFQRLHQYARTPDDIQAMIAVLNPVYYLSRGKFAVGDTPAARNERLVAKVSDLLGIEME